MSAFDFSEFTDLRVGTDVLFRRPIKFRKRSDSTVRVRIVSIEPLRGEPVELIRSWWAGEEFMQHRRKLRA